MLIASLAEAARLGRELGEAIGVPAVPRLPGGFAADLAENRREGAVVKCLGAGDETVLLASMPGSLTKQEEAVLAGMAAEGRAEPLASGEDGLRRERWG